MTLDGNEPSEQIGSNYDVTLPFMRIGGDRSLD